MWLTAWLLSIPSAVAVAWPLAWGLPCAAGAATKKKKSTLNDPFGILTWRVIYKINMGVPVSSHGLRICHWHCFGTGLNPGPGTFIFCGHSQKNLIYYETMFSIVCMLLSLWGRKIVTPWIVCLLNLEKNYKRFLITFLKFGSMNMLLFIVFLFLI